MVLLKIVMSIIYVVFVRQFLLSFCETHDGGEGFWYGLDDSFHGRAAQVMLLLAGNSVKC